MKKNSGLLLALVASVAGEPGDRTDAVKGIKSLDLRVLDDRE